MRNRREIMRDIKAEMDGNREHRQTAITQEILLDIRDSLIKLGEHQK